MLFSLGALEKKSPEVPTKDKILHCAMGPLSFFGPEDFPSKNLKYFFPMMSQVRKKQ